SRVRGGGGVDDGGGLDGRQLKAELAARLDGKGEGRTQLRGDSARLRRAVRQRRLRRGRPAREVGARCQDPRHLRGNPTDTATDRGAALAGQDLRGAAL